MLISTSTHLQNLEAVAIDTYYGNLLIQHLLDYYEDHLNQHKDNQRKGKFPFDLEGNLMET